MSKSPPLGITDDPLFAGVTRPAMAMGVTYSALLINGLTTVELFLLTKNLLWMLVCIPIHGIFWLVCKNDARFFDLQRAVFRHYPEIDQIFLSRLVTLMKFHIGEKTVAVDRAREVDIIVDEFEMLAIQRIIKREHTARRSL